MITYNLVIIENKTINSFLNFLDEGEFLEKLWEWCYEADLWDFIDENPEILNNSEDLEDYLLDTFIPEDLFHHYEDDDIDCFAFTVSDEKLDTREYNEDRAISFVLDKIKKHYKTYDVTLRRVVEHITTFRVVASSEEEAKKLVLSGMNNRVFSDDETGEIEEPEVVEIKKV